MVILKATIKESSCAEQETTTRIKLQSKGVATIPKKKSTLFSVSLQQEGVTKKNLKFHFKNHYLASNLGLELQEV